MFSNLRSNKTNKNKYAFRIKTFFFTYYDSCIEDHDENNTLTQ